MNTKTIQFGLIAMGFISVSAMAFAPAMATATDAATVTAASTPSPAATTTPQVDTHPFLSGTFYRTKDGMVETMTSKTFGFKNPDGTTTQEVYMYDKAAPAVATTVMGGNFALVGNVFVMMTADGYFYKYPNLFTPSFAGGNFFIDKKLGTFVTVNSSGVYFQTDEKLLASSIRLAGGNYYLDSQGLLTAIKSDGSYYHYTGIGYPETRQVGGNFFMLQNGTLVTIDSTTAMTKVYTPTSATRSVGGNYFIGQDKKLYTVDHEGNLSDGYIINREPEIYGYSYIIFKDGTFCVIAGDGTIHERMIRTSATNARTVITKIDLTTFDRSSVYVPSQKGASQ